MNNLPIWNYPGTAPAFNDTESLTATEASAKVYAAMRELITEYNGFHEEVTREIESFKSGETKSREEFELNILCLVEKYTLAIDEKIKLQDSYITEKTSQQDEKISEMLSGLPDITQVIVSAWLSEHPEVTTTVQDNSLGIEKFTDNARLKVVKDYVTPKMFGAACDGVTDDTNALLACVEHCKESNKMLCIPHGTTILIPTYTIVAGLKQLEIRGKIKAPNGIEFRYNSNLPGNEWYFNTIEGALTVSGLKDALVTVIYADSLTLLADSSVENIGSLAYCQFVLSYVKTITLQGNENGWINENFFYGGRIRDLTLNGSYCHNNNHFYNNSFESSTIIFNTGRSNYIHNARFEGTCSVTFGAMAANNYVHAAWTGETIPGRPKKPGAWWNDSNGLNYYYNGINPPLNVAEKRLTANSFNYCTDKMWVANGKLHNKQYNLTMLKTDFIDITHGIGLVVESDVKFFRPYVYLYDENKNPITTPPEVSIFHGCTMTWDSTSNYYRYGSSSVKEWNCSISRNALLTGNESVVKYIKITISGYDAADIDYFSFKITAPWYVEIYPFENERLTATSIPTTGEWKDGLIAYNTTSANKCLGWFYNNGAWHEIGTYTT